MLGNFVITLAFNKEQEISLTILASCYTILGLPFSLFLYPILSRSKNINFTFLTLEQSQTK
jgi:hypothetical protein